MILAVALVGACGDDDDDAGPLDAVTDDDTTDDTEVDDAESDEDDDGEDAPDALTITLAATGISGLPEDLDAGLVNVTVDDQTEGAGGEVNFTRISEQVSDETFASDLGVLFAGGPVADYFDTNAGVVGSSLITLDQGEYVVWYDGASALDRESTPDDIVTTRLVVEDGDDDAELPEADGAIVASDYAFEVDVPPGPATVNFHNDGPDQLHHAVIVDFGTADPDLVEAGIPEFLTSDETAPPPEGIDPTQVNFEFGGSGVFGPGGSGTFSGTFEEGRTYGVFCFISDRSGGAPHAIQYDMWDVFQVGAG
jgi:hypothetical protein